MSVVSRMQTQSLNEWCKNAIRPGFMPNVNCIKQGTLHQRLSISVQSQFTQFPHSAGAGATFLHTATCIPKAWTGKPQTVQALEYWTTETLCSQAAHLY